MDNEKRFILSIVLCLVILIVYQSYFMPPPPPQQAPATAEEDPAGDPQSSVTQQPRREAQKPALQKPAKPVTLPDAVDEYPGREVEVTTNKYTAVFSSSSRLKSFRLHDYNEKIRPPAIIRFFRSLLDRSVPPDPLIGASKELITAEEYETLPLGTFFYDTRIATQSQSNWQSSRESVFLESSGSSDSVTFTRSDDSGLISEKIFSFSASQYKIDLLLRFTNNGRDVKEGTAVIEWAAPLPENGNGGFFGGAQLNSRHFSYFLKDKVEKKELKKCEAATVIEGDILWTAIEEKYFTSAVIPENPSPANITIAQADDRTVTYHLVYPNAVIRPGEHIECRCSLFLGPKDIDILKSQGARLEKTVDFGSFDIIAKPLVLVLKFFYRFTGNYGIAIILLTVIIKIIFWPLTHKSFESMKGMQKLQPEIAKLKEKYQNNKEEFARQQMSLYKKYKVNPLGGCLPMLLQIPVFIALYRGLMDSIELRHAVFIPFWINDLSAKDPTYIAPIVMGASMLLQQKMTPTTADPTQAKMMMFMPIVFTVMFLNFPSGLVVYWLVNNVISIAQQLYINRKNKDAGGTECNQSKSKPKPSKKRSR